MCFEWFAWSDVAKVGGAIPYSDTGGKILSVSALAGKIWLWYNKVVIMLRNEWSNESNISLILSWCPLLEKHGYS